MKDKTCAKVGFKDYPNTSCECSNCPTDICRKGFIDTKADYGIPSSLALPDCSAGKSKGYICWDKGLYNINSQPNNKDKIINLNTLGLETEPGFQKVECKYQPCNGGYVSDDPRLIDAARGMIVPLDKPPLTGETCVSSSLPGSESSSYYPAFQDRKYSCYISNYGKNYSDYSTVNSGQIQYYIDKDISDAYFYPLFTDKADVENILFVDPMGSIKPRYIRHPVVNGGCGGTGINYKRGYKNTFTADAITFRESIMEGQMAVRNQQKWEARYTNPPSSGGCYTPKKF